MLTSSEILNEYTRCLMDPVHAIETYLETFDKTQEGFVPFNLFYKQKEIVKAYKDNRFNIITKPRQAGVSTTTAAYLAIQVAFADKDNPEAILILANKQDMAQEFLAKVKDFLLQLPRWVWGAEYYGSPHNESKSLFITESKKELMLPNKSRVKAVATSKDALRGYTPTYLVMDEAAFIDNGVEVFGAALTALGCLTKDSLVLTDNGLVEMDELVKEKEKIGFTNLDIPHKVCNMNGDIVDVTQTFVSEYGQTFKIKTKTGVELEGSWKHPILVERDGNQEWVRMCNLKVGDQPIIQYNQNLFSNSGVFKFEYESHFNEDDIDIPIDLTTNLDFSYLLGLFVAEGNFTSKSKGINITNVDNKITEFLINDGARLGKSFNQDDERHYTLYSRKLVKWFEAFGLKKHNARYKEIPLPILKMPKEVIRHFLRGMFDGDGMSTHKDIKYSSTSHKLIKTLQTLLLNFGIVSHIKKEVEKTSESSIISNKEHICEIYNLKIYSNYALKFYDEIGFSLDRKQNNHIHLRNKKLNSRYVNVTKSEIFDLLKRHNQPKYKNRYLDRFWESKYDRLSYHCLNKLSEKIGDDFLISELYQQVIYNDKFYIDEIVEIVESEDYTYDLHVPLTNSFISNGIISHNTGGRATLISTPNGQDPLYYETYEQAKQGENNFNIVEMKWYEDPRYNKDLKWHKEITKKDGEKEEVIESEVEFTKKSYQDRIDDGWKPRSFWYDEMCKGMNNNARMIAQELDVSFLGSGGNVIADEHIQHQEKFNVNDPKWIHGEDGEYWIWEQPKEGHKYIMGVDVARGDGADASTIVIIDMITMEQVMEYKGKIPPDLLANIVLEYGELYDAYVVVDITGGMGVTTVLKLVEYGYKKLHYDDRKKLISKNKNLESYTKQGDLVPGFNANGVRLPMIAHLEYMIRTDQVKVKSRRLTGEMRTFIYNKSGRPDHQEGKHDDLLMALAMALFTLEHSFKKLEKLEKKTKAMLDAWVLNDNSQGNKEDNNNNSNGFVSRKNKGKKATPKPKFPDVVKKNMQDPNGDYMWLFSGMK